MKHAVLVFLCFSCVAGAQEQKHMMTANAEWPTALTALEIERMGHYPSAVHLKGAVEIISKVCFRLGKRNELVCDGEMILQADEATFHEDTGQIEARGAVTVIPLRHAPNERE